MLHEFNTVVVAYTPVVLASGVIPVFISAVIRAVNKVSWTHNDLVRAAFAFIVFVAVAAFHMLMTSHQLNRHLMLLQGAVLFVTAQPFFYALVRPAFKQVDAILAKSAAYDAQLNTPAITKPAADFTQP